MTEPEISFEVVGDETHYSCGCRTQVVGDNFLIKPYSLSCEVYEYILKTSKEMGHELEFIVQEDKR